MRLLTEGRRFFTTLIERVNPVKILVAALGILVTAFSSPIKATPALAWSSDDVDYAQDVRRQRAAAAFATEGWDRVHPSGSPPLATVAFKGSLAGVILCVDRAIGADHSVAVVFVTGGENGQPDTERDRLDYYMKY